MNVGHLFLLSGVVLVAACWWAGREPASDDRFDLAGSARLGTAGGTAKSCTAASEALAVFAPPTAPGLPVAVYPAALHDRTSGLWVPTLEVRHLSELGGSVRDCDITTINGEPRVTFAAALSDAQLMAHDYRVSAGWTFYR